MTETAVVHHEVRVAAEEAGERVDKVLARALPRLSRARVQALIKAGGLSTGGATIEDPSHRVKPGHVYRLACPPAEDPVARPEAIPLAIRYEDDDLIIVDKPAGLVVHPAPGNPTGTLVNALIAHCGGRLAGVGGVRRPGIVHRLDKDTSGLMVAVKTDAAHHALARQFAARSIERVYLAVVRGVPVPAAGEVRGAVGRDPRNRKRMAVVTVGGKPALTHYRVVRAFNRRAALVACRLATGRTHQIRVHMASIGHPVVGDRLYARAPRGVMKSPHSAGTLLGMFGRQALHAQSLGFDHPSTGQRLFFESPLPSDMAALVAALDRAAREKDYK
ncbi:MAG: RluA family pseudouridine synthase [Alphaproteobacteria bacterium]|nr:RluA family pseudouridine synthase [Alphaproteobacteria bacterium]